MKVGYDCPICGHGYMFEHRRDNHLKSELPMFIAKAQVLNEQYSESRIAYMERHNIPLSAGRSIGLKL